MANSYDNNPWFGWAEDNPEAMYRSFLDNRGSYNFLTYWKNKYNDVYGDYMGSLGTMALGGQAPSLNFYDYLSQNDPTKQWNALAPWQRGQSSGLRSVWNIR